MLTASCCAARMAAHGAAGGQRGRLRAADRGADRRLRRLRRGRGQGRRLRHPGPCRRLHPLPVAAATPAWSGCRCSRRRSCCAAKAGCGRERDAACSPGEVRVAAVQDGVLVDYALWRPGRPDGVGDVHRGRVTAVVPGMAGAFVALGGADGFLPDSAGAAGRGVGDVLAVRVVRAAQGGKGPRLAAWRTSPARPARACSARPQRRRAAGGAASGPVIVDDPGRVRALRPAAGRPARARPGLATTRCRRDRRPVPPHGAARRPAGQHRAHGRPGGHRRRHGRRHRRPRRQAAEQEAPTAPPCPPWRGRSACATCPAPSWSTSPACRCAAAPPGGRVRAALAPDPASPACSASPRSAWPRSSAPARIRRCTSCWPARMPPGWPRCGRWPRRTPAARPRCAPPPTWSARWRPTRRRCRPLPDRSAAPLCCAPTRRCPPAPASSRSARVADQPCPICGRQPRSQVPAVLLARCADVDLGRWFTGHYRVPARPDDEAERRGTLDPAGAIRYTAPLPALPR